MLLNAVRQGTTEVYRVQRAIACERCALGVCNAFGSATRLEAPPEAPRTCKGRQVRVLPAVGQSEIAQNTDQEQERRGKGVLASVSAKKKEKCASDRGKFRASGAPKASATCFKIGHTEKGAAARAKIIKSGKTRRWTKL